MEGSHTTLPAGAKSGFEFRTAASGLDADPLRGGSSHPPTAAFSDIASASTTRIFPYPYPYPYPYRGFDTPATETPALDEHQQLSHNLTPPSHSGRWLAGAGATPAEPTRPAKALRGSRPRGDRYGASTKRESVGQYPTAAGPSRGSTPLRGPCIARRTPLAPVRDAPLIPRTSRVPACVRSRWGRGLPAPVHRTMTTNDPAQVEDTDLPDPGAPERRVQEARKQLRIALADLPLDTTARRSAAQEIKDALDDVRNADDLLSEPGDDER